jgi:leucyl aminopeptidase
LPTPKLALSGNTSADVLGSPAETVIVGTIQGSDGVELATGAEPVDDALEGKLAALLTSLGATGKADEVIRLPTFGKLSSGVVLAAGLGKRDGELKPEQVRRAAGAAARALAGTKRAYSLLSTLDLQAAAEGAVLGAYAFTEYKSDAGRAPIGRVDLAVDDATAKDRKATLKAATAIAEAVCTARDLINTPPTTCTRSPSRPAPKLSARRPASKLRCSTRKRCARPASAVCSASAAVRPACRASSGCTTRGPRLGPRSRWSARASPSTPAASRSSRRPTWTR